MRGELGDHLGREHAVVVDHGLGDQEEAVHLDALPLEHGGEVGGELLGHAVAVRDAVHDHVDGHVALGGGAQHLPGHGVGVAVRGRDEEPQVRGAQQLAGELAVARGDGVDVGRVQQREALGDPLLAVQLEGGLGVARSGARASVDAGEAGQDAGPGEPRLVLRMVQQHGTTRGGPDRARTAHRRADEGIDEGGLPGAGRAADHHQQRRVEGGQARGDVVGELGERGAGLGAGLLRAVDGQRQLDLAQVLGEGVEHLGGAIGHGSPGIVGHVPRARGTTASLWQVVSSPEGGCAGIPDSQSRNGSRPQSGKAPRRAAWTARSSGSSGS